MDKQFNDRVVEDILTMRLPSTEEFQKCSFILPNGKYLQMYEHYEAFKFLVVEQLVQCIPDAEQLLSDLGYIRYSWIGYVTLPTKEPNKEQYQSLEVALVNISKFKDDICIQVQNKPNVYQDYPLSDIPYIIKRIKTYYAKGKLKI